MSTVELDSAKLDTALTKVTELASALDSQRTYAKQNTPISLPSLDTGKFKQAIQWLEDQKPQLKDRRDLALLLERNGDDASYELPAGTEDSLAGVQERLGTELAEMGKNIDSETDEDTLALYKDILDQQKNNGPVMDAMFSDLGPDGTAGVIKSFGPLLAEANRTGEGEEQLQDIVEGLRSGLETASNEPGFPAESFASDMIRYLGPSGVTLSNEEREAFYDEFPDEQAMTGANLMTFMMEGTGYSDDFLLGAAEQLDELEQRPGPYGAVDWYQQTGTGPFPTDGPGDPMAAIMHNFGENPEAGYEFFADDPDRQLFYFDERNWEMDGYGGISHAMAGITTNVDLLEAHPDETTLMASNFFDKVANSEGFNAEDAKNASPYIADMLKFYMPAVDKSLRHGEQEGGANSEQNVEFPYYGTFEHYPEFYRDDLDALMQVGMSTEDGMTSVAEGIGTYQQTQVNNAAVELGLDPNNPDTRTQLRGVLENNAALQGFAEYSVGQVEIDAAEDRDQQRQALINLVGDAAGLVPIPGADQVGELGKNALEYGVNEAIDLGTNAAGEEFANEASAATDDANSRAEDGSNRAQINAYLALVEGGVIPEGEVDDRWYNEDGSLKTVNEIDPGDVSEYTNDASNGYGGIVTDHDLEGSYKNEFLEYYGPASDGE